MSRSGQRLLRAPLALFGLLALLLLAARCRAEVGAPEQLRVVVRAQYPHDAGAFTQGLLWYDGALYESTGRYGESSLREVELESGRVLRTVELPATHFGEGLARVGGELHQLSWKSGRGWVYDLTSFDVVREFDYRGEGWGLCHDGAGLWVSNGSSRLVHRDVDTFAIREERVVTIAGREVSRLNELECAEGWIYANVLGADQILKIEPHTGRVAAVIDAAGLLSEAQRGAADVLNGIAYDAEREVFYLTGKLWPTLFEATFE